MLELRIPVALSVETQHRMYATPKCDLKRLPHPHDTDGTSNGVPNPMQPELSPTV